MYTFDQVCNDIGKNHLFRKKKKKDGETTALGLPLILILRGLNTYGLHTL